jgi:hypothetical protein
MTLPLKQGFLFLILCIKKAIPETDLASNVKFLGIS